MLVTPYFRVALSARADTKPYAMFSRHASISKPALSIAARYWSALHCAADAGSPRARRRT